ETKPAEKKPLEVKPKPEIKPPVEEKAPVGQAYVVQLGALKNAAKVNEIVAMLRLSGHRAFTVPATPVQGEITRLYVGPDASKQKLQSALPELNALSGLNGQVKPYTTSR
ncbi:cell division protein DedD, partial [Yersinia pestis]